MVQVAQSGPLPIPALQNANEARVTQSEISVPFQWLEHGQGLDMPTLQTAGAAGMDLCAALAPEEVLTLAAGAFEAVPCGFAIALPQGFEAQVRPRSGLAFKHGVTVLNAPGTIDADYRGEIKVMLINHSKSDFKIRRGDRIAQMVVAQVSAVRFDTNVPLDETARGADGFGSTGFAAKAEGPRG